MKTKEMQKQGRAIGRAISDLCRIAKRYATSVAREEDFEPARWMACLDDDVTYWAHKKQIAFRNIRAVKDLARAMFLLACDERRRTEDEDSN